MELLFRQRHVLQYGLYPLLLEAWILGDWCQTLRLPGVLRDIAISPGPIRIANLFDRQTSFLRVSAPRNTWDVLRQCYSESEI